MMLSVAESIYMVSKNKEIVNNADGNGRVLLWTTVPQFPGATEENKE
jgi:hypothetical protein